MARTNQQYTAEAIEVLSGLDPVRRRPGMYTDTVRPNHLAQEAIDNSVDEAMAGHATQVDVTLYKDGSLEVIDDGRGMPIDIHPEEKVTGVELILTRLHAGAKFSNKSYKFSGGLHGVGISVVNALSTQLIVKIKKYGQIHEMQFKGGEKASELEAKGSCGKHETGTSIRFWSDPQYFDSAKFSRTALKHVLRAKAVLCPGLKVNYTDKINNDSESWYFEDGIVAYMNDALAEVECLPRSPFVCASEYEGEMLDVALTWLPEGGAALTESYVNLIPTVQGGTHVNGLRTGLLEAMREFCEYRKLLPRGVKLAGEDLWENVCYVISVKLPDPLFSGQTKERLSSRKCAAFVANAIKDAFSFNTINHYRDCKSILLYIIKVIH